MTAAREDAATDTGMGAVTGAGTVASVGTLAGAVVDASADAQAEAGADAATNVEAGAEMEAVIPQFYADRELFITGVTGFLGKMVVARVLATCPRVRRLHVLVRARPPASPADRLRDLKQSPVFESLRRSCPRQLDKVRLVAGDVTAPDLGLSPRDVADLQHVSVVINAAPMVKLDERLAAALQQNVGSVQRLLDLCDRLPRLEALVHVSTAFCGAEHPRLDERVCPAPRALASLLRDAAMPLTREQARRLISPKPNTYTFTKMVAENVVEQRVYSGYGRAIFRPTIVISSLRDPFPGWVEKLHGPSGVAAGVLSGALRVMRCDATARADMLPVDIAADTLIAVAWETALDQRREVRVYNCAAAEHATDWEQLRRCLNATARAAPSAQALWRPHIIYVKSKLRSWFKHRIAEFFLQTLPLFFAEFFTRIFSNDKDRLDLRVVSARLRAMNGALEYFATRSFWFPARNVRRLRARLSPPDAAVYNLDPSTIEWPVALSQHVAGARRHLLREPDESARAARRRLRRLYGLCVWSVTLAAAAAAAALAARALRRDSASAPGHVAT